MLLGRLDGRGAAGVHGRMSRHVHRTKWQATASDRTGAGSSQRALVVGNVGFVVKDDLVADLLPAIRTVLTGQSVVSASVVS